MARRPYMLYHREDQQIQDEPWDRRRRIQDEYRYVRGLYPQETKRLQRIVEMEFDRIDRERGPMYDDYPDREFLYRVRDRMLASALAEGIAADRDMIQVLMLHELLQRRSYRW